jgi:hypothetical protein
MNTSKPKNSDVSLVEAMFVSLIFVCVVGMLTGGIFALHAFNIVCNIILSSVKLAFRTIAWMAKKVLLPSFPTVACALGAWITVHYSIISPPPWYIVPPNPTVLEVGWYGVLVALHVALAAYFCLKTPRLLISLATRYADRKEELRQIEARAFRGKGSLAK